MLCRMRLNSFVKKSLVAARHQHSTKKISIMQLFDNDLTKSYVGDQETKKITAIACESINISDKFQSYVNHMSAFFLPKGYPHSVAANYKKFVLGQMIALTLSSATGVMAMQSMLCAIGIGSGTALPLAATLNWVLKDGLGQFGGVVFASFVSNRFDMDPKRWRLAANLSMDSASFLELLTPLAPAYFLLLAAVANVGKNIAFLAASASRAAIHKSFATHENLADVTAKTGSQCIVSSMLGTSLGLSLVTLIGADQLMTTAAVFLTCSAASTACTYWSLRAVTLTTLTNQRLDCVLHRYFSQTQLLTRHLSATEITAARAVALLTPVQLAEQEVLLGVPAVPLCAVTVGAALDQAVSSLTQLQNLINMFVHQMGLKYVINIVQTHERGERKGGAAVSVLLLETAARQDVLSACVHAHVIRQLLAAQCDLHDWSDQHFVNKILTQSMQQCYGSTNISNTMTTDNSKTASHCKIHKDSPADDETDTLCLMTVLTDKLLQYGHLHSRQDTDTDTHWVVEEMLLETRRARIRMPC